MKQARGDRPYFIFRQVQLDKSKRGLVMGTINPLHIKELIRLINSSPFFRNLSMVIETIETGLCIITIDIEEKHLSPYAAIQGGVYPAIIDAAAYWAPYPELPEDVGLITMDVSVNYTASVKDGRIIARGERIKTGRTICLSQVLVHDDEGKVLAQGTSKLLVTRGLQTIPHITGYSAESMPAKFLDDGE
jgi:uncharacterized protein (TIGR00369 family)